jgi:octaprenyl-diphosphate synthase
MSPLDPPLELRPSRPGGHDLTALYRSVQADLDRVEEQLDAWSRSENPLTAEVSRYVLRKRGKRLRPSLVLLTSRLFPGGLAEDPVFLASIVELLHTASLIHDDIVDKAETRRGAETVHSRWGANITVLLGDYLYIKTLGLALDAQHGRVIRILTEVSSRMIDGELGECALSGDTGITEGRYFEIIDNKTAALFSACCRLGAILGGASPEEEHDLGEYGRNVGLCFQIIDDLLDFTGDGAVMGKPVLSDLGEGRVTLPLIRALNGDGGHHNARIQGLLQRRDITQGEKAWLLQTLESVGALSYTGARAAEFAEKAVSLLARFPESEVREALARVARTLLSRNS